PAASDRACPAAIATMRGASASGAGCKPAAPLRSAPGRVAFARRTQGREVEIASVLDDARERDGEMLDQARAERGIGEPGVAGCAAWIQVLRHPRKTCLAFRPEHAAVRGHVAA